MCFKCPQGNLTEERISELVLTFRDLPPIEFLSYTKLRPAAVLVPVFCFAGEWNLLLTRRTETVNDHKSQVSFPGGAAEPEDASPVITALREAHEEVGISPDDVKILGSLPAQPTITGFMVTPVVGKIPWPYEFRLSMHEVDRVFSIPLSWLSDTAHLEERSYVSPGGQAYPVMFFNSYDGETLWGISARITWILLKALQLI
ncbi:MAG: CoA pyrophosphatase [Anaerolineaceae bacterium]|nr:CoA pyrophosphatase [Anaerolineaceae bacterium]